MVGSDRKYLTVTLFEAESYDAPSMFILYLAEFSSFWFQCTRSAATPLPGTWQWAQVLFAISVAVAFGSRFWLKNVCWVNQDEPALLSWQVRQASRLGRVFQLSPCGVAGLLLHGHGRRLSR